MVLLIWLKRLLKNAIKTRIRAFISALVLSVILWDSIAYAWGGDTVILTEIAFETAASHTQLGAILTQTLALVAQVKEQVTLTKVAWGALNELRHMSAEEFGRAVSTGMHNALPEIDQIYGDIKDIGDLNYRNHRAYMTLRGMLWDSVYGPAIEYMDPYHETLNAMADSKELGTRNLARNEVFKIEAEQWEKDCKAGRDKGELGPCQTASQQAAIRTSLQLADMQATQLSLLEIQRRQLERGEREDANQIYMFERWHYDFGNLIASRSAPNTCIAGQCLYQRFGAKMSGLISKYRNRHPTRTASVSILNPYVQKAEGEQSK